MAQIQPKQVKKVLSGYIKITGLSVGASASSLNVTSQLTSALTVAGDGGTSVPLIASTTSIDNGVAVTSPGNKCEIWNSTTKLKLTVNSAEVYARLTFGSSVYTLSFYYLDNSGVETSYSFPGASTIDFDFIYRFKFHEFPSDAFVSIITKNVYQDSKGSDSVEVNEVLIVTSINTLSNMSTAPAFPSRTILYVNGKAEKPLPSGTPPFTISTNQIIWNSTNALYALETTDTVIVTYYV